MVREKRKRTAANSNLVLNLDLWWPFALCFSRCSFFRWQGGTGRNIPQARASHRHPHVHIDIGIVPCKCYGAMYCAVVAVAAGAGAFADASVIDILTLATELTNRAPSIFDAHHLSQNSTRCSQWLCDSKTPPHVHNCPSSRHSLFET